MQCEALVNARRHISFNDLSTGRLKERQAAAGPWADEAISDRR